MPVDQPGPVGRAPHRGCQEGGEAGQCKNGKPAHPQVHRPVGDAGGREAVPEHEQADRETGGAQQGQGAVTGAPGRDRGQDGDDQRAG
jgi:hypothetical protein